MNYKVIQDFQFTNSEKKIDILKVGTILMPDASDKLKYVFKKGSKEYLFHAELLRNNPDFFERIDWRNDLLTEMKKCKQKTLTPMYKTVINYLDNTVFKENILLTVDASETLADACVKAYHNTKESKYLFALKSLGYDYNELDQSYFRKER